MSFANKEHCLNVGVSIGLYVLHLDSYAIISQGKKTVVYGSVLTTFAHRMMESLPNILLSVTEYSTSHKGTALLTISLEKVSERLPLSRIRHDLALQRSVMTGKLLDFFCKDCKEPTGLKGMLKDDAGTKDSRPKQATLQVHSIVSCFIWKTIFRLPASPCAKIEPLSYVPQRKTYYILSSFLISPLTRHCLAAIIRLFCVAIWSTCTIVTYVRSRTALGQATLCQYPAG